MHTRCSNLEVEPLNICDCDTTATVAFECARTSVFAFGNILLVGDLIVSHSAAKLCGGTVASQDMQLSSWQLMECPLACG